MTKKQLITKDKGGTFCPDCGPAKGAMFAVNASKLEEFYGHRVYECDKCHSRYKYIPKEVK